MTSTCRGGGLWQLGTVAVDWWGEDRARDVHLGKVSKEETERDGVADFSMKTVPGVTQAFQPSRGRGQESGQVYG